MKTGLVERIFISGIFLLSGLSKLLGLDFEVAAFERWGYPAGFMYAVGILEIAGAVGLWIKHLSAFAGLCLCGMMTGAIGTHLVFGEWRMLIPSGIVLLLTAHYTWRRREQLLPKDREPPP